MLERTAGRWQEGKLVKVDGKLRLRGDQYSLACDDLEEYSPPASDAMAPEPDPAPWKEPPEAPQPETEGRAKGMISESPAGPLSSAPPPPPETAPVNGHDGSVNGHSNGTAKSPATQVNGNGKGKSARNGNESRAAQVPPPPDESSGEGGGHSVVLQIRESDDAIEDAHLLREVIQVLLEYPGKDRVHLEIYTGGRRVLMELPVVSTEYCSDLDQRLQELIGPNTVSVESLESLQQESAAP